MPSAPSLADTVARHRAGDLEAAEAGYRAHIEQVGSPDAMQLLATLLHQRGAHGEALSWLDRALQHYGEQPGLLSNRAAMLLALQRPGEALQTTETILNRDPQHPGARHNQLLALADLGQQADDLGEKISWYQRYEAAGGEDAGAWLDYANALRRRGLAGPALEKFTRAQSLHPESQAIASSRLISSCLDTAATTASLGTLARSAGKLYQSGSPASPGPASSRTFGFYSPRFGAGPMASLLLPVLETLRGMGIRTVLFSAGIESDDITKQFREAAGAWHNAGDLDYHQFAQRVRAEDIGVMFDLCGHSPGNRLADFGRRLAPVQIVWGDWFMTTGMPGYDYYLGDPVANPGDEDQHFTEQLIRLPRSRFTFRLPPGAPEGNHQPPSRPLYASCNRLAKLTPATLACWSEIMARVPEADLLLCSDGLEEEETRCFTRQRFADHGISGDRLQLQAFRCYGDLLEDYRRVTLALDPFPFNGCVTSFDALLMGTPVVALHGSTPVARQSASILHALGLGDWVAEDTNKYVELATGLAQQPQNARARQRLASIANHPLLDPGAFTRDLLQSLTAAGALPG